MIVYSSRQLNPHERNYLNRDLEFCLIVFALSYEGTTCIEFVLRFS